MRPPEPPADREDVSLFRHLREHNELHSAYLDYDEGLVEEESGTQCPEDDFERTIYIQTHKVGYLIGHHGRTILGFENDSGAKIDILDPKSKSSETPIRVSGREANVRHALRLIMDLYAFNNFSSEIWQNPQSNATFLTCVASETVATEEILVTPHFATFIVQNDTICYIEAMSGSKVMICRESDDHPNEVPIAVTGNAKGNEAAVKLIQGYLADFYENESLAKSWERMEPAVYPDNPYKKFGVSKRYFWSKFESEGWHQSWKHESNRGENKSSESGLASERHFQEVTLELTTLKPNFEAITLHPICRYNNVTMETFIVDANQNQKSDKDSENPTTGRKIVIRGQEANVKNAKLDLLRQIDQMYYVGSLGIHQGVVGLQTILRVRLV